MNHSPQSSGTAMIRDHQLVRRIGQGGYGQIWLARNAIGTYREVQIAIAPDLMISNRNSLDATLHP